MAEQDVFRFRRRYSAIHRKMCSEYGPQSPQGWIGVWGRPERRGKAGRQAAHSPTTQIIEITI